MVSIPVIWAEPKVFVSVKVTVIFKESVPKPPTSTSAALSVFVAAAVPALIAVNVSLPAVPVNAEPWSTPVVSVKVEPLTMDKFDTVAATPVIAVAAFACVETVVNHVRPAVAAALLIVE